jgi:hypothetical protein
MKHFNNQNQECRKTQGFVIRMMIALKLNHVIWAIVLILVNSSVCVHKLPHVLQKCIGRHVYVKMAKYHLTAPHTHCVRKITEILPRRFCIF